MNPYLPINKQNIDNINLEDYEDDTVSSNSDS